MKIIRVSATWCTSCIVTYSDFLSCQKKYPEYEYIEYDYDIDEDVVKTFQIGDIIPVLIAIDKNGKEVSRLVGEKKEKDIIAWVEQVKKL